MAPAEGQYCGVQALIVVLLRLHVLALWMFARLHVNPAPAPLHASSPPPRRGEMGRGVEGTESAAQHTHTHTHTHTLTHTKTHTHAASYSPPLPHPTHPEYPERVAHPVPPQLPATPSHYSLRNGPNPPDKPHLSHIYADTRTEKMGMRIHPKHITPLERHPTQRHPTKNSPNYNNNHRRGIGVASPSPLLLFCCPHRHHHDEGARTRHPLTQHPLSRFVSVG